MAVFFTHPIAGAHFRLPAKGILSVLPHGQPLVLRAEPDNDCDANAIQVILAPESLPKTPEFREYLNDACQPYGWQAEDVLAAESIRLGYIPRDVAAYLRCANIVRVGEDLACTFVAGETAGVAFSVDDHRIHEAALRARRC